MDADARPRVLCVDDEAQVLEGLTDVLRRRFDVVTATGATEALRLLRHEGPFAVVLSDMRMPGIDGAGFLGLARQVASETVRMVLTGEAALSSALAAVNKGQIFRFLVKPCPREDLLAAFDAAVEQHRLVSGQRILLEETLAGSLSVLTETLALTSPAAFGRAARAKQHVGELAAELGVRERWAVEVAAMLSQTAFVTLPDHVAGKVYHGQPLADDERAMVDRLPEVTDKLLGNIPRLETVRAILRRQDGASAAGGDEDATVAFGAEALRIALDFDVLETQGLGPELALDLMRGRSPAYDPLLLEAFARLRGAAWRSLTVTEVAASELAAGMVLIDDVRTENGTLLAGRGGTVTVAVLERVRNLARGVREPLRVGVAEDA